VKFSIVLIRNIYKQVLLKVNNRRFEMRMPKTIIKKVVVTVNLFEKYHDLAVEVCEEERISFSSYVNRLIESNLKRRGYTK